MLTKLLSLRPLIEPDLWLSTLIQMTPFDPKDKWDKPLQVLLNY